ncbi:MAG: hypothetical protein LAP85_19455 [Acidobacteriia bacterium]|nr:hypothetical protein [Terriglobia bacterium]
MNTMKQTRLSALSAGLCLSLAVFAVRANPSDCTRTSVGLIPLTDLGAGYYQGKQGGLYPGGSNMRPAAHEAAGLAAARALRPLDARGLPDDTQGKIVLISVGMSNTTMEFSTFKPMADADPVKNPKLVIVDGAQGGMTARIISDLTNPNGQKYWATVDARLGAAGVTAAQVQAAWVKEADAQPTGSFPGDALALKNEFVTISQILTAHFPNIRLAYWSSRIYAGYASTALNPEPYAYQSGFAVKWLIEDQINGSAALNFNAEAGPVKSPWLAWGPYLWADGLNARRDGLIYKCSDLSSSDGTHPASPGAREKVARLLLDFLKSDSTAKPWFLRDEKIASFLLFPALVDRDRSTMAPGSRVFTGVAVTNLDAVDETLTFTALDKTGNLINGPGIENPKLLPLPARAQLPRLDFQIFGDQIATEDRVGWFRVDSTGPNISGFFLIFDDALSVFDGANAVLLGTSSFILPDIADSAGFAMIQVANAGNDGNIVRFELIDSGGIARAPAAIRILQGSGALIEPLTSLFPAGMRDGDYLRATADHPVVPLLLWGGAGRYLKAMGGQDAGSGAPILYAPQYAVGGNWRSTLSVVNLDNQPGTIKFEFTDTAGNSIARVQSIVPHGKLYIDAQNFFVDPDAGLREGYVRISSSGVRLAGGVSFGDAQQSCATALPLISKLQDEVVFSQFTSDATYYTGIAILNPADTQVGITVEVYDSQGVRLAANTDALAGNRSKTLVLSNLPDLKGLNLTSGYIKVKADQPIASFALFGTHNNSALSAIPPQAFR